MSSPKTTAISIETVDKNEKTDSIMWQTILGKKARDALLLGMWSIHLKGSGEHFGNGNSNEQNNLLGIQYYGLAVGTFINSYDDRSWFFGPVREVYSRKISENTRLDIGYKLGLLFGYGDHMPNVGGTSLFGAGTFGFSWHRLGADIMIIPTGVISGGFRIDFD